MEEIMPALLLCAKSSCPVFWQNSCKSKNDAGSVVITVITSPELLVAKNFLVFKIGNGQLRPDKSNLII